jgi:hypothetical protein
LYWKRKGMNYPQHPPPYGHQPYGHAPQRPFPGYPTVRGSGPAVAIIAAVLGLVTAAAMVVLLIDHLTYLGRFSFGGLDSEHQIVAILQGLGGLIPLIGAIIVFTRNGAGAIMLAIGGSLGMTALLLPPMIYPGAEGNFAGYFGYLFSFFGAEAISSVVALITSPLTVLFSLLPPTSSYLNGPPATNRLPGW